MTSCKIPNKDPYILDATSCTAREDTEAYTIDNIKIDIPKGTYFQIIKTAMIPKLIIDENGIANCYFITESDASLLSVEHQNEIPKVKPVIEDGTASADFYLIKGDPRTFVKKGDAVTILYATDKPNTVEVAFGPLGSMGDVFEINENKVYDIRDNLENIDTLNIKI